MNWIKVYDLANDKDYIHLVQQAAIRWIKESGDAAQDRPLVGSPEWWKTVESGELESHWVTGTIKRPLWTGMNDFPEVEVQEESGKASLYGLDGAMSPSTPKAVASGFDGWPRSA